jgi:AcrR family transcriptional regulator
VQPWPAPEYFRAYTPHTVTEPHPSARRAALLAAAYEYVLANGMADLSLRPLAASTGTSPRVLLYLFGSKDGLVREILAHARTEQREMLRAGLAAGGDPVDALWSWLSAPEQRSTIRLFVEAYARSLHPDPGPWRGFARDSVSEWLESLGELGVSSTLHLALLRGLLFDLLATGEVGRVNAAYREFRAVIPNSRATPDR